MEIKYTPNVEEEIVAEEFDSQPVEKLEDGLPPRSRTRERARKSLDQHLPRIQGWYRRKRKEEEGETIEVCTTPSFSLHATNQVWSR
uniref:Uncharacterized protein n=1 Tax=Helianthus annuus TaxID=4232 RepID=A0A251U5C9_HELAN